MALLLGGGTDLELLSDCTRLGNRPDRYFVNDRPRMHLNAAFPSWSFRCATGCTVCDPPSHRPGTPTLGLNSQ
jgi:hypothetical protein